MHLTFLINFVLFLRSTIVLPKEEFPSLSLISRNYQDSEYVYCICENYSFFFNFVFYYQLYS